jgi:type IV fimbrial biogenesis protein FimT
MGGFCVPVREPGKWDRGLPAELGRVRSTSSRGRIRAAVRVRGFTLIELVVTVGIVAILASIALPSFVSVIKNDTATAQANSLVFMLNYARSEAVEQDTSVTICPSTGISGASETTTACTGASSWQVGMLVYCQTTSTGTAPNCNPVGTSTFINLRYAPALPSGYTVSSTAGTSVTFTSSGAVSGATGTTRFTICDSKQEVKYARDVEVLPSGRVEASTTPGQTIAGTALTCP